MQCHIFDTYEAMSRAAAAAVMRGIRGVKEPLLCLASGNSPLGLYRHLVQQYGQERAPIDRWKFIGLDEWIGLDGRDEGSCRYMLDEEWFLPLKIPEYNICFFDGKANDMEAECRRAASFIQDYGPIDLAVLGLGMNGHIGFNEPGTSPASRLHVADLDPLTRRTGRKYFPHTRPPAKGITLGIADLMEAKKLVLVINGGHKAAIVRQVLEQKPSSRLPASWLKDHPGLQVYLDGAASALL